MHSSFGISDLHHEYNITEHAQHVRHFHTQLGQLLDDAEQEQQAADEAGPAGGEHLVAHHEHGHEDASPDAG